MKRHLKKQIKALRRQIKKKEFVKRNTTRNRYWPSIFCIGENMFIGVSYYPVRISIERCEVVIDHWKKGGCAFRTPEHEIDMTKYKKGDIVWCPKCGAKVDFRMWLSSVPPQFCEKVGI